MLECFLGGGPVVRDTGPGPQDLLKSYKAGPGKLTGFYGRVASADFITYSQLLTGVNLGGSLNTDIGWMKLHIDGKVLFVPRSPICTNITWNQIYNAGAVYGIPGAGVVFNNLTPKNQNLTIVVQGYKFLVRCFVGANSNPVGIDNGGARDSSLTKGCEYDRLILNMGVATQSANQEGPIFGYEFSNSSTAVHVANYSYSAFSGTQYTLSRNEGWASAWNPTWASTSAGWLPVLELLGKA